ncbi:hypothetical protein EV174_004920 [Coemansia sp. RSA 2320]|nr:hypothetical protein EV174_004920 [Coemansia sp. RSA 2320]
MPPPVAGVKKYTAQFAYTVYVPDHVDISTVQKCLEDRRANFIPIDSSFDADSILKDSLCQFVVLDKSYFTLCTRDRQPAKFGYKSRNVVMSQKWRSDCFANMPSSEFTEIDGIWQPGQLPVLHFVFGRGAHSLHTIYLVDDNTICEFYEDETAIDMFELAAIAQRKSTCVSHFFVVNRGLKYWVVSTADPNTCFGFGPSIKTRVISKLVDSPTTIQALIDESQPLADIGPPTNHSPNFKLHDCNGEEIVEGETFALRIIDYQDDGEDQSKDDECERNNMFDFKSWVDASNHSCSRSEPVICATIDSTQYFGMAVVDGIVNLTFNGQFLHIDLNDEHPEVFLEESEPPVSNRIQIRCTDSGDYTLSTWEGDIGIVCDWVKGSYGNIYVDSSGNGNEREQFKLRLVKV